MNDMKADEPALLLIGAVSLLIVLTWLYRGGWRFVLGVALGAVKVVSGLAGMVGMLYAIFLFWRSLLHPDKSQPTDLLWAIISTAVVIVLVAVNSFFDADNDNSFTRFLDKFNLR